MRSRNIYKKMGYPDIVYKMAFSFLKKKVNVDILREFEAKGVTPEDFFTLPTKELIASKTVHTPRCATPIISDVLSVILVCSTVPARYSVAPPIGCLSCLRNSNQSKNKDTSPAATVGKMLIFKYSTKFIPYAVAR